METKISKIKYSWRMVTSNKASYRIQVVKIKWIMQVTNFVKIEYGLKNIVIMHKKIFLP